MPLIWDDTEPIDPFIGPKKPWACTDGWTSHTWTVSIEEGQFGFKSDCRLCTDGIDELEREHLGGEFEATLHCHKEYGGGYYDPETYYWWEIVPITSTSEPDHE